MGQMHQIQLTYKPEEDRILLRINTTTQEEFRFWMTRRYVLLLWQALARLVSGIELAKQPGALGLDAAGSRRAPPFDPLAIAAKAEMEHQAAVSGADFQSEYQEGPILPLGSEPALLHRVAVKPNASGQAILCLHPENGAGIELVLNEQILHSFCQLMADTAAKAEWGIELRFAAPPAPPGGESGGESPPPAGLN